jgi:hypothetical protein
VTNKKDLIIAVLATFCLTATMFMVASTRSETPIGTYDPIVDLNHDGKIDILDAIILANHFGTSGTPVDENATLADLQARVDRIEQFLNQSAHVELLSFGIGYAYFPHYWFGIAGSWNASKLLADPIADRLNASLSGMSNVTLNYYEYQSQQFFEEPQLSQGKGYGQFVDFWYVRVNPPNGLLSPSETETVRTIIEDYLAKP